MATVWDSVVSAASKAATQAGEATQTAATKTKLHADLLLIDRDISARKEKFGVDMYAHLEQITSTQEFYVADDRLINVIRPTLIKAQREVAAYERKRDALKGKVNMAEANRAGSASILGAQTIGEKLMNAARYAAAGAKEASSKTELAMIERQILGFKEEFGLEMYPVFESMEDNEGWLPTDRKVRALYDQCREDIADMVKAKEEKKEQIKQLDGVEGTGLAPPTIPQTQTTPTVVATPVYDGQSQQNGQMPQPSWSSPAPQQNPGAYTSSSYGSSQPASHSNYGSTPDQYGGMMMQQSPQPQQQQQANSGFSFMGGGAQNKSEISLQESWNSGTSGYSTQAQAGQQQNSNNNVNPAQVFDPFDGIGTTNSNNSAGNNNNPYDPFAGMNQNNGGNSQLNNADLGLFKY